MREIKFRAWNGKQMLYDVVPWGENTIIELFEYDHSITTVDSIMQYTGLKDKNGRGIYEGDIVRLDDETSYTVCWNEAGAFFDLAHPEDDELTEDRLLGWWMKGFEIIGNIHENPELLERSSDDR